MGIRPSMATIFGIDNFTPNKEYLKFMREDCEEYPPLPNDGDRGGIGQKGMYYNFHQHSRVTNGFVPKTWYDLVWHNSEFGERSVIGYITATLPYDSEVVRAMSLIDDRYFQEGHTVVPATAKRAMVSRYSGQKLEVLPQHRYGQSYFDEVDQWILCTQYLFRAMQMSEIYLAPENMRWMLVWQWS